MTLIDQIRKLSKGGILNFAADAYDCAESYASVSQNKIKKFVFTDKYLQNNPYVGGVLLTEISRVSQRDGEIYLLGIFLKAGKSEKMLNTAKIVKSDGVSFQRIKALYDRISVPTEIDDRINGTDS